MSQPPNAPPGGKPPPGLRHSRVGAGGLSGLPQTWSVHQARLNALGLLTAAGVEDPAADVRALMEGLLGITPAAQIANRDEYLDTRELVRFREGLNRRMSTREPVSRILGRRGFWTFDVDLTPDVLDPRPETEILVDAVLARAEAGEPLATLLDLGTGSGCLITALLLELPQARGIATDISPAALDVAARTAASQGVANRLRLVETHWAEGLDGPVDAIVCNPPYIADGEREHLAPEVRDFDPPQALYAGEDGLQAYRTLAPHVARLLRPGGILALELGQGQGDAVADILWAHGLDVVERLRDLADIERCLVATPAEARGQTPR